ncbi:MAG: hypothetical protein K6U11_03110 [bacterium]|nr:hypothetical protein [bacterium]
MLRHTFSKIGWTVSLIIFSLLITLAPLHLLHAEPESGVNIVSRSAPPTKPKESVKIVSHATIPECMVVFQAETAAAINLYLARSDGQIQQLTYSFFAQNPSFSPDGKSVFFEDSVDDPKTGRVLYQIFKLDLDSKKVTQISNNSALDCNPSCSPDGKRLAFCTRLADPNADTSWRIYLMDINGQNRSILDTQIDTQTGTQDKNNTGTQDKINVDQLTPCWSPDGSKIAFVQTQLLKIEGFPLAFPIATAKIMDLKTKTITKPLPGGFAVNETVWSPQGDRIAFRGHDPITDTKTIWTFTPDGSRLERITDGPDDAQPAWWPDGTKLIFARRKGKEDKKRIICLIDLKTKKVTELLSSQEASLERPQVLPIKANLAVKPNQRHSSLQKLSTR